MQAARVLHRLTVPQFKLSPRNILVPLASCRPLGTTSKSRELAHLQGNSLLLPVIVQMIVAAFQAFTRSNHLTGGFLT
jgi:hypothetical protein